MVEQTPSLCSDCAQNPYLSNDIRSRGAAGLCTECGLQKSLVFDLATLASSLERAISSNFSNDAMRYVPSDDDRVEYENYGDPLETVVPEILCQDLSFIDELLEAIVEAEDFRPQDGDVSFYEAGALYGPVERRGYLDYFSNIWNQIREELKHKRRFFSSEVRDLFDTIFDDVETLRTWECDVQSVGSVVQEMPVGYTVYRGRVVDETEIASVFGDPFQQVGPPPRKKARTQRMSPEGVVALYCSMHSDTAIAEVRPAIGTTIAVIALSLTRPLKLLNLERLERALEDKWDVFLDPDYDSLLAQDIRRFLRQLHHLVSLPVVPGNEAEYLITQVLAEYLVHIHEAKFDGIIFKSVQHRGGTNMVLFSERGEFDAGMDQFAVRYLQESLTFHRVDGVKYTHTAMPLERLKDRPLNDEM